MGAGPTFGRGRSPPPPPRVCVCVCGGYKMGVRNCLPPGEGCTMTVFIFPPLELGRSPGVRKDGVASGGHRGKQERAGRGGPGGHFLPRPGAAQFCEGSAAKAGGAGAGSGPEAQARARPAGSRAAATGRTGKGVRRGTEPSAASHPVSPESPPPQLASSSRDTTRAAQVSLAPSSSLWS